MSGPDPEGGDRAHPQKDVRAGPGDAGASDRPVHRSETASDRREGRRATRLLVWLVAIGFVIVFALNIAALV